MLDTHARLLVQPVIDRIARGLIALRIPANAVTASAAVLGVAAAILVATGNAWVGIVLLWCSGLLDALDGTMARMTRPSPLGAIMDITFDRVVELAMVIALAILHPRDVFPLLILAATIAVAMSLFLSIGATLRNTSAKAFHYVVGLGERTEAFICLSLIALDAPRARLWTYVFIAVIVFTLLQRFRYAARVLSQNP
ncbi:MAG: CDP-alcohol phosphatidyltransferase family protein [Rhodanobacteraceae bacterium]|nr:MAG: CDP-alcohol phosphatidyltransferase family protein [Rhodanobacteraceae bacterium]